MRTESSEVRTEQSGDRVESSAVHVESSGVHPGLSGVHPGSRADHSESGRVWLVQSVCVPLLTSFLEMCFKVTHDNARAAPLERVWFFFDFSMSYRNGDAAEWSSHLP